jgi:hypothetical protein
MINPISYMLIKSFFNRRKRLANIFFIVYFISNTIDSSSNHSLTSIYKVSFLAEIFKFFSHFHFLDALKFLALPIELFTKFDGW